MHTNQLTHGDMAGLMQKLAVNFGGKRDLEAKAELWYEKLRRYPLDVVQRVVDRLLTEEHQFFPMLGRAVKLAREMAPVTGSGEGSLAGAMQKWEADPWGTVGTLESDRQECKSSPCPACGSVVVFSDRGAVIVHDDQRHRETRISYSNMGKAEWFEMGPVPEPVRRPLSTIPKSAPMALAEIIPPKPAQPEPSAVTPPLPPPEWEAEQQARAEAAA